ncbi:MAG TPA: Spy/CpxP family protein refolding chaperone [Gemmatimonadales bacterium]|nr:Spy/CpxP family protein refolding chaperone [Gemmatimonadales bacterium]
MRRFAAIAVLSLVFATPMFAQTPQGDATAGGPRRFQPPPDHWMTIDSLGQALGLTPAQRTKVAPAYTALNGVMKDAAARRQAIRQQMQSSGFTPGQEPTPEQRAKFDSVRAEMQGFQAEADQWYAAIRNNLTPDQQTKFDALPKPMVFRPMGGGPRQ